MCDIITDTIQMSQIRRKPRILHPAYRSSKNGIVGEFLVGVFMYILITGYALKSLPRYWKLTSDNELMKATKIGDSACL